MRCPECGADLPEDESCADRFHALLAAEQEYPQAAAMHGLFVFTYHAQHPSLCKPWLVKLQRRWMSEIFADDKPWREVIAWPADRKRRQQAVDRAKQEHGGTNTAPGRPLVGESTVADLGTPGSPGYPRSYPERVERWARSVAEHRFI